MRITTTHDLFLPRPTMTLPHTVHFSIQHTCSPFRRPLLYTPTLSCHSSTSFPPLQHLPLSSQATYFFPSLLISLLKRPLLPPPPLNPPLFLPQPLPCHFLPCIPISFLPPLSCSFSSPLLHISLPSQVSVSPTCPPAQRTTEHNLITTCFDADNTGRTLKDRTGVLRVNAGENSCAFSYLFSFSFLASRALAGRPHCSLWHPWRLFKQANQTLQDGVHVHVNSIRK